MVYKPKKTVNGHKRNDRATRYRKRVKARKAARARLPVRSNVKRYVAEQLDKIAPDNRYYFNVTEETANKIKPTCQLDVVNRIYPFGASFQKRFINMEFRRMAPVIKSGMQTFPQLGSVETQWGHSGNTSDYHYDGSSGAQAYIKNRSGNFNHWRSIIGRGIHMKSSSVYGTITAFPNVALSTDLINSLRTADLCLHMFVLEDKAITKTDFMDWYQDLFDKKKSDNTHYTENAVRADPDTWRGDTVHVPYCAGSAYVSNTTSSASSKFVASETLQASPFGPKSDGTDEFLIDWRQFYKHDDSATTPVNHSNEVFHNTRPCTTAWNGSYDHSVLPINKSRFIVHEHKKWSIKPDSNGNVKRCIPWSYTFPDHYMTYEKELLDLPFYFAKDPSSSDKQGITPNWLFPRKQPFIVFCWSRCSTEGPLHVPNNATQGDSSKTSGFTNINHDDVFHIDMNMKCHYENALATKNVPTINKGKPLVHKRESRPRPRKSRTSKKKSRQSKLPEWMSGKKPNPQKSGAVQRDAGPPSKKTKISSDQFHPSVDKNDRNIVHMATKWVHENPVKAEIGAGVVIAALSIATFGAADTAIFGGALAQGGKTLLGRVFLGRTLEKAAPILGRRGYTILSERAEQGAEMMLAEDTAAGQFVRTQSARIHGSTSRYAYEPFNPGLMSMH